jgi:hypothetical protein
MASKAALNKTDKLYPVHLELWKQIRACLKGKYAVIDNVTCLPIPQYSSFTAYDGATPEAIIHANKCAAKNVNRIKSYWARGRFFNATGQTHVSLDGIIWAKPAVKEIPKGLSYIEETLEETAKCITNDLISVGRYGLLVDMADAQGSTLTQEQQESKEYSPKFIKYTAEQIKYVRLADDNETLAEVRLIEFKDIPKGSDGFEWETVEYTRRLIMKDEVYNNELYNDKAELVGQAATPTANGSTFNHIPFQFFGSDSNTADYSNPPLYDLANVNLGHFVLDCDNRDNLHFHGQGMTNIFTDMDQDEFNAMNPNGLDVGAKGTNMFSQGDKVELLQVEATGAIPAEMLRDEQRMIYLGAQLVQDSSGNQTLGAKEIESNASTSTLKQIANNVSDGLENCIEWAAMFAGASADGIKYELNTQFITDTMDAQTLLAHLQYVQSGLLPKVTIYDTARKAGFTKLDNEELEDLALEDDLSIEAQSENEAKLQAEIDSLREQLNA